MKLRIPGLKILDIYIIKKFLGTYIFTILAIISIAVMFDFNEKVDKFIAKEAPVSAIIFDYYLNFIPYYVILFSPLFIFIAVIFFTSKLANDSEIIAILSSGVSFRRLLRPYMISATIIAIFTLILNSFVIPPGSVIRMDFENTYVKNKKVTYSAHIQAEVEPGLIAYFDRFDTQTNIGNRFTLDKFDGEKLQSRLTARFIQWDSLYHWTINNYTIRDFVDGREIITTGASKDTILTIMPSDFMISSFDGELMTTPKLKKHIDRQKARGIGNIQQFEIEYHKRFAMPFAAFILTVIGLSISSRKVKGGMGLNIGLGLLLSFSYILFQQISSAFAINGTTNVFIATWIPNLLYTLIAIWLYRKAPR